MCLGLQFSWSSVLLGQCHLSDHILWYRQAHGKQGVPQKAFDEAANNFVNNTNIDACPEGRRGISGENGRFQKGKGKGSQAQVSAQAKQTCAMYEKDISKMQCTLKWLQTAAKVELTDG